MAILHDAVVAVHVVAGFGALAAGAGALLTEKGGRRHRLFGRAFLYGLGIVSVTAIATLAFGLTAVRILLSLLAVFGFYFAFSGYRALSRAHPAATQAPLDRVATTLFLLASGGIAAIGVLVVLRGGSFSAVLLVFGTIGLVQGGRDLTGRIATAGEPDAWLQEHLARMGAAYIATVTAFSAVNLQFLPLALRWLWATAVGVPAIVLAQRRYRARFERGDLARTR